MKWQLISIMLLVGCSSPNTAQSAEHGSATFEKGEVTFHLKERDLAVQVEVARTGNARRQGLMYRKELRPHHGMIFAFQKEEAQSFWMKNTYITLDIIFVSQEGVVVGIVHNAEPMTTTPRRVPGISQYVVEMVGGYANQYGIQKGTRISMRDVGKPLP